MVHLQEWILLYVHTGYNDAKYTPMNLIQTKNKQKQTLLCTAHKEKRLLRALLSAYSWVLPPPCLEDLLRDHQHQYHSPCFVAWGLREAHPCIVMFPVDTWVGECVQACLPSTTCCPPDQEFQDHCLQSSPGETTSLYHKPPWKGNIYFLNECLAGGIKYTFKYFLK